MRRRAKKELRWCIWESGWREWDKSWRVGRKDYDPRLCVSDFPNYFRSIISCGLMFPFSKLTPSSVALLSRSFWYMFYSLSHISPWIWSPPAPVRSDSSPQQIWHSRISLSLHRLIFSLLVHFFLLLFLLPVSNLVFSPSVWLFLCLPSLWASDLLQKEKGSLVLLIWRMTACSLCICSYNTHSVIFTNVKIRGVWFSTLEHFHHIIRLKFKVGVGVLRWLEATMFQSDELRSGIFCFSTEIWHKYKRRVHLSF